MKVKLALLSILAFVSIPGKEFASARLLELLPAPNYAILKAINADLLKQKSPCGTRNFPKDPCSSNDWVDGTSYYICDTDSTRLSFYFRNCTLGYIPPAVFQIKELGKFNFLLCGLLCVRSSRHFFRGFFAEYLSVELNKIVDLPTNQLKSLTKLSKCSWQS
jgi:hypothetical protein